jgi:hypothetical protein
MTRNLDSPAPARELADALDQIDDLFRRFDQLAETVEESAGQQPAHDDEVENLRETLNDTIQQVAGLTTKVDTIEGEAASRSPGQVPTLNDCLEDWVEGTFVLIAARPAARWCINWAEHPEAHLRLKLLWISWEAANASGETAAMGAWLKNEFDYHSAILLSETGPFVACQSSQQRRRCLPARPLAGSKDQANNSNVVFLSVYHQASAGV